MKRVRATVGFPEAFWLSWSAWGSKIGACEEDVMDNHEFNVRVARLGMVIIRGEAF